MQRSKARNERMLPPLSLLANGIYNREGGETESNSLRELKLPGSRESVLSNHP